AAGPARGVRAAPAERGPLRRARRTPRGSRPRAGRDRLGRRDDRPRGVPHLVRAAAAGGLRERMRRLLPSALAAAAAGGILAGVWPSGRTQQHETVQASLSPRAVLFG